MDNEKKNIFGWKLGQWFAIVLTICLSALAIGITAKILIWMF